MAADLPARGVHRGGGYTGSLLATAAVPVREVLELGSGGGHNAVHLKADLELTLVDLSDEMLAASRALNPECTHHQGDRARRRAMSSALLIGLPPVTEPHPTSATR